MKVLFIVIGIIILIAAIIALRVFFGLGHPGNAAPYALRRQLPRDNSPLRGKTILCLGSSISSLGFPPAGYPSWTISPALMAAASFRRLFPPPPWRTGDTFPTLSGCAAAWPAWPQGARLLPVSAFHQ